MDNAKALNIEKSGEQKASRKNENVIENRIEIRIQDASSAIESEQSKDICKESEDVTEKPDDSHTRSELKNPHKAEILARKDEANLHFSSLEEKRKIMKPETVSRKKPVKIQKNIKCGRVDKGQRRKPISLRRTVLQIMTQKKFLSQTGGSIELSYENNKSQTERKDLQDKKLRIPDEVKEETRNDSLEGFDTNSSFLNKFQFPPTSSNRSQEVSTNKDQLSCSSQSTSASINAYVTVTKSPSPTVKSAEEVWEHFIWFLQTNKESFDRTMTGSIRSEDMEISDQANASLKDATKTGVWEHFIWFLQTNKESFDRTMTGSIRSEDMEISDQANTSLKDATKTVRELTSQSLVEPFKTKTESIKSEIPDNLKSEISATRYADSPPILTMIEQIRAIILKETMRCEGLLVSKKIDGHKEKNMKKKVKLLIDAKKLQRRIHKCFDTLFDHEEVFKNLKQEDIYSNFAKVNLSNATCLTDLPLSATHIRTFSSLFLYQHKSLYSEVQIESVFERINLKNLLSAFRRYQERKAINKREIEISEKDAFKLTVCFNNSLEEYRLKQKNEIPNSENWSLEDYQNYIIDLKITINENLNCLRKILSAGTSVVFPVVKYLREYLQRTLMELYFLDRRRTEVFPKVS